MTDAAHRLSDAELAALTKRLAARPVPPDHPPRASVVDIATHRPPLGLSIIADDDEPPERDDTGRSSAYHGPQAAAAELVAASIARLSEAQLAACPSWRDLLEHGIGTALAAVFDGDDAVLDRVRELKAEVAKAHGVIRELQLERERDRASLAEMRSKVAELDFIVSRLKVENAGPAGPPGPRGVDGRDGARGPRGERGAMGPAGPRPVSFDIDAEGFAITGLMSDGRRAPTMHLRALFEQYHSQTNAEDDAAEDDAARASRAATEREAEIARQRGLSSR